MRLLPETGLSLALDPAVFWTDSYFWQIRLNYTFDVVIFINRVKTGRCCFDGLYSEGEWCLDSPSSLSSWHSHLQVSILQLDHVAFKDNLSVTFKALFFWIHGAMSHPGLWNHQLYGILCFQLGISEAGIQKALLNWARERQPQGTVHTSHHSWALVTL